MRRRRTRMLGLLPIGLALIAILAVSGVAIPVAFALVVYNGQSLTALILNPPPEIAPTATTDAACPPPGQTRLVLAPSVMAAGTSTTSQIEGSVSPGDLVCLLQTDGEAAHVAKLSDGSQGWISARAIATLAILNFASALGQASANQPSANGVLVTRLVAATSTAMASPPTATATPSSTPSPAPSGGVGGTASVTVSQSLLIRGVLVSGGAIGLGVVNDNGTGFTAAVETNSGSFFDIALTLTNASNAQATGVLDLQVPSSLTISASAADGVSQIARSGANSWLFVIDASHSNAVPDITLHVKAGLSAGTQTITGTIRQSG